MRAVQSAGGFAMVIAKGEPDAGTLMVLTTHKGLNYKAFERMPSTNGGREWALSKVEDPQDSNSFTEWLGRRRHQDPDLWIVELDIAQGERFIGAWS